MLVGRSLDEVNERANAVASYVCSQPGRYTTDPAELGWTALR